MLLYYIQFQILQYIPSIWIFILILLFRMKALNKKEHDIKVN